MATVLGLIGIFFWIIGVMALAAGITWESRMNDVRRASRYVAALR